MTLRRLAVGLVNLLLVMVQNGLAVKLLGGRGEALDDC